MPGRVQGVGFRAWTCREARRLGLSGWVRNRADGTVEAVAAGPDPGLDAFLAALRRGPASAEVTSVETAPTDGLDGCEGFSQR